MPSCVCIVYESYTFPPLISCPPSSSCSTVSKWSIFLSILQRKRDEIGLVVALFFGGIRDLARCDCLQL